MTYLLGRKRDKVWHEHTTVHFARAETADSSDR